ncbi:MAG: putative translation initiation inhibitor, yjgF family [Symbiobacteriaceae bacterium]|nr:putative translation initiation inhibitor, yjgF family [Symbiobacteriaceae bacterium]
MSVELINPPFLAKPKGYSHMARAGSLLVLGGVTGMDERGIITCPGDLPGQMDQALANIRAAVAHAGGQVTHIIRMRIYTTQMAAYRRCLPELGAVWRKHFGRHYPAMALLGVGELFDPEALLEIESEAMLP